MPVVAQAFYRVVGMNIGKSSRILMSTKVQGWNHISIGDHTYVNSYCHLDGRGRLTIGNYVNISNYSVIISAGHDMKSETFAYRTGEVCIDDLCWIGSRAMILDRFHLAPGAVLSAGSVFKCESFGGGWYGNDDGTGVRYHGQRDGCATSIDARAFDELKAFPQVLGAAYAVEGGARLTTGQMARMALFDEKVNCLADCHTEVDQEPFLPIG